MNNEEYTHLSLSELKSLVLFHRKQVSEEALALNDYKKAFVARQSTCSKLEALLLKRVLGDKNAFTR